MYGGAQLFFLGVNIGGTKSSLCAAQEDQNNNLSLCWQSEEFKTSNYTAESLMQAMSKELSDYIVNNQIDKKEIAGIGISCGGPLSSSKGVILSPPNLPGWDYVPIVDFFEKELGIPTWLCNDANACALAEWKFGAGQGKQSVVFLTFGTGMGAGLLLEGHLIQGVTDTAGEIGHVRLEEAGPVGFGKMGSFEGFCSGGGIAQLAQQYLFQELQQGKKPAMLINKQVEDITAKDVGESAQKNDPLAKEVLARVGDELGKGLSILIDVLNPDCIIIGSIFARCYDYIWPSAKKRLEKETLAAALNACQILPSGLGESIGNMAAVSVAHYEFNRSVNK